MGEETHEGHYQAAKKRRRILMVDLIQRIHQENLGMNQAARLDPARSSTTTSFPAQLSRHRSSMCQSSLLSSIIAWAVWRSMWTVLFMVRMETSSQAYMLRGKSPVVYTATTVLAATLCWIVLFSAG